MVNPTVRRARRDAARGRRLPQRPGLQCHGRQAGASRPVGPRSRTVANRSSKATGLLARAFQHEMDHLDGLVFIDRLRGIKRDLIVRRIQKLTQDRQVVDSPSHRLLRHAGLCRALARGTALLATSRRGRRLATGSSEGARASSPCRRQRGRLRRHMAFPVLQPVRIRDEAFLKSDARSRAGSRRRRGVRAHPSRRSVGNPQARHDQRACVAAAALSRCGAHSARGPGRRRARRA